MHLEQILDGDVVVVRDVHHQDLEAVLLYETFFVLSAALHQLLPLLRQQLVAGFAGQQRQQCHQPERQLLVLHLQHQQLQQVALHDVILAQDQP